MFNINLIRDDLTQIKKKLKNRQYDISTLDVIKEKDIELREYKSSLQKLNELRNKRSSQISEYIKLKKNDLVNKLKDEVAKYKIDIEELTQKITLLENEINELLSYIPNICDDSVPVGKDENDNKEIKKWGNPTKFDFKPLAHWDLAKNRNLFLTDEAAKITGSRFVIYVNDGARLYRALQQFTLDKNIKNGYIEVLPQVIINNESLYGTSQLPKFANDVFKLDNLNYYLSPTAEVQLTNLYRNTIVDSKLLPIKLTANTPCFRSEAGSAGRDTRGAIRLHQFYKTEIVVISNSEDSFIHLENITMQAESILEELELPYRRVLLCTGDTGFSSAKTFDIEVWLPSYNNYKEISSCSNCLDFQARRTKIRYKDKNGNTQLVHTLNGSSLAIDRLWVAIVENYQNSDGSITIPKALIKYMDNKKFI